MATAPPPPSGSKTQPTAPTAPTATVAPVAPSAAMLASVGAAMAAILASGLAVAAMLALALQALAILGIGVVAATAAFMLAGHMPHPPGTPSGAAGKAIRNAELGYRAAYIVNAALRIERALRDARARGESQADALRAALKAERRYFRMSVEAMRHRAHAGQQIDMSAKVYGDTLGWYLGDRRSHTPACLAANGRNFSVRERPAIGWPGTVHSECGCWAGPPFPNRGSVDDATRGLQE